MTLKQLVWNKFSYESMENLSDYQVFCLEFQLSANMKHSVWIDFSVCIQLYFQNKLSDKSKYFALNKFSDSVRNFVRNQFCDNTKHSI